MPTEEQKDLQPWTPVNLVRRTLMQDGTYLEDVVIHDVYNQELALRIARLLNEDEVRNQSKVAWVVRPVKE